MGEEHNSSPATELAAPPGPVPGAERIGAVDTLRGVAVLGILVMNIYAFAMPTEAYGNPLLMGGTEWYNLGTWFVTHIFFDQKFMSIFSMLFGGGLVIMWQRAEAKNADFGSIFFRRQVWLVVIGMAHAYLVWFGDILFYYAIVGMLVYAVRRWTPQRLILLGILLLPIAPVLILDGGAYLFELRNEAEDIARAAEAGEEITAEDQAIQREWETLEMLLSPSPEQLDSDVQTYQGSYSAIVRQRAPEVLERHLTETFVSVGWPVGGLMLIGMALMKLGILAGSRSLRFYKTMLLVSYGFGLPFVVFSAVILANARWDSVFTYRIGVLPNYLGSIPMALGHIAAVMLIVKSGALGRLMARFSAVGRMALSNYLMHSIVMTTIFYGYGLGLYGQIPRAAQMLFVAGMLGLQLWLSPVWLRHFRFGPAEWLWRSLTYWQRQPMRRRN